MSLLFPRVIVIAAAVVCGNALAAGSYFVPSAEVDFVHHSNPLLYVGDTAASGYQGSVESIIGFKQPLSTTEIRPRLEYTNYSNRTELRHLNEFLDFNNHYTSERNDWQLVANYSRENSYASQRTSAVYDTFDPNDPTVDSTGRISTLEETYTRVQVRPEFSHQISERLSAGFGGYYQKVSISGDQLNSDAVDYKDMNAGASLSWAVRPRTRIGAGLYAAKYETDDGTDVTNGSGLSLSAEQNWSQRFTGTVDANIERTKVDRIGVVQDDTFNSFAVNFGLVRKGQTSSLRFNGGRSFSPSTGGARTTLDQIRIQYNKQFKPLWSYLVAVRAFRNRDQGVTAGRYDRDYATAYLQLNHDLTRTWYVTGNYSYTWQKYSAVGSVGVKDSAFTVGVGYRGLGPQR